MKGVQCYELFGGIALKIHTFSFSFHFQINIGVHQRLATSPMLLAIGTDVATNEVKDGMLQEILYADDLYLTAETMSERQKKLHSCNSALECNGLRVNLVKIKGHSE